MQLATCGVPHVLNEQVLYRVDAGGKVFVGTRSRPENLARREIQTHYITIYQEAPCEQETGEQGFASDLLGGVDNAVRCTLCRHLLLDGEGLMLRPNTRLKHT